MSLSSSVTAEVELDIEANVVAGSRRSAPNTTRRSPSSAATAAATSNPGTARVSAADARKTLPKVAASSSTSAAASPQREAATIWRNLLPPGYVPPPRVRGGLAPNPSDGRASAPFTSTSNGTRQLSSSAATASSSSKPKNIQVHAFSDKLKAITSAKTAANASYGNSYALHLPRSATIPLSSIHHHSHSHSYADSSSMHRAPREPVVAGYSYKGAVEDPDKITWTPNGRFLSSNGLGPVLMSLVAFLTLLAALAVPWVYANQQVEIRGQVCSWVEMRGWSEFHCTKTRSPQPCHAFFQQFNCSDYNWRDDLHARGVDDSSLRWVFNVSILLMAVAVLCALGTLIGFFVRCVSQDRKGEDREQWHFVLVCAGAVCTFLAIATFAAGYSSSFKATFDNVSNKTGSSPCEGGPCESFWGSSTRTNTKWGPAGWWLALLGLVMFAPLAYWSNREGDPATVDYVQVGKTGFTTISA